MSRQRKRHVQVAFEFSTWGGKRKGAGRKQTRKRKSQPHRRRQRVTANDAVHVSLRVSEVITNMRRGDAYKAIRRAIVATLKRTDFRITHASIQMNHIHLICEADDEMALARGVQAFEISAAKHLNAVEPRRNWGTPRKAQRNATADAVSTSRYPLRPRRRVRKAHRHGVVFPDRYHAEIITSPRRARSALAYVLNNWRRHRQDQHPETERWYIDPFSSGVSFSGWKEGTWKIPASHDPLPVCTPQTWLLREGWKKWGPISVFEVPGPRD